MKKKKNQDLPIENPVPGDSTCCQVKSNMFHEDLTSLQSLLSFRSTILFFFLILLRFFSSFFLMSRVSSGYARTAFSHRQCHSLASITKSN